MDLSTEELIWEEMQSTRERVSLSMGRLSAGRMEAERLFFGNLYGIFVRSNIFITQADSVKYVFLPFVAASLGDAY